MKQQNLVLQYIKKTTVQFSKTNYTNIENEILWYLESLNLLSKTTLYTNQIILTDELKRIINKFVLLKKQNVPLQYIINKASFFGRDFYVNQDVLIPRPETETIIRYLNKKNYNQGLEIGTGSGIISITLLLEKIVNNMIATEISQQSIEVCKKNLKLFNIANLTLLQHDILNENIQKKYDIIISNPPYISLDEYDLLPPHIKDYEPQHALTDNSDGVTFYKRFVSLIKNNLNNQGVFICEIGSPKTYKLIHELFSSYRLNIKVVNDLNKDPRILIIKKND